MEEQVNDYGDNLILTADGGYAVVSYLNFLWWLQRLVSKD